MRYEEHLYYEYHANNFTVEMECTCGSYTKVECSMSDTGHTNNTDNNKQFDNLSGKGNGKHFSNEELLVYLQQHNRRDELWHMMHQHMLNCPECRQQIAELERTEYVLKTALSPKSYGPYPSITGPVMEQIHSSQQKAIQRQSGMRSPGRLAVASVAIALVVLFVITFGSIFLVRQTAKTPNKQVSSLATTAPTNWGIGPLPTPTMKPTATSVPIVTSPVVQGATFWECTTAFDQVKQHLRICGSNFKIGDNVVFTLVDSKGKIMKQIGPTQIPGSGTFSQNITIHSCKDVPSVIYAQDTSVKPSEDVVTLKNIWYGNC